MARQLLSYLEEVLTSSITIPFTAAAAAAASATPTVSTAARHDFLFVKKKKRSKYRWKQWKDDFHGGAEAQFIGIGG